MVWLVACSELFEILRIVFKNFENQLFIVNYFSTIIVLWIFSQTTLVNCEYKSNQRHFSNSAILNQEYYQQVERYFLFCPYLLRFVKL